MAARPVLASCLAALAVAGGVLALPSTAEGATPAIRITKIYYNSPGSDTGSNTSLNAEYVRITNRGTTNRSLTGWTLKDKQGYTFRFPTFTLKAGYSVVIHTGKGTASATNRYYNRAWYVWNNTGDTAYLRDAGGVLKDSWAFTGTSAGYVSR
ncbi:lamin tail domain-containing protein [Pedococcus sp. 5OH_020]|uniref:lamin tail domain-containing protein n=1 Tax=Pedococcus sp. 5OH_020 TaxID=2989814 RepID=UPI0022E9E6DC|nr:lamin tail domain-containing protein [Pedococcus sp. 5OH_020]